MQEFQMQSDSTVKVFSPEHGLFTMTGDKFTNRIQTIVSSVNYDSKAHKALCAALSEATDVDYFDADLALVAAASIECGFDNFTVNYIMADSDDELWIADVKKRFEKMPSF